MKDVGAVIKTNIKSMKDRGLQTEADCPKLYALEEYSSSLTAAELVDYKKLDAAKIKDACVESVDKKDKCELLGSGVCNLHLFVGVATKCDDIKEGEEFTEAGCKDFQTGDCKAAIDDGYAMSEAVRKEACDFCEKEFEGFYCSPAMMSAPSILGVVFLAMCSMFGK